MDDATRPKVETSAWSMLVELATRAITVPLRDSNIGPRALATAQHTRALARAFHTIDYCWMFLALSLFRGATLETTKTETDVVRNKPNRPWLNGWRVERGGGCRAYCYDRFRFQPLFGVFVLLARVWWTGARARAVVLNREKYMYASVGGGGWEGVRGMLEHIYVCAYVCRWLHLPLSGPFFPPFSGLVCRRELFARIPSSSHPPTPPFPLTRLHGNDLILILTLLTWPTCVWCALECTHVTVSHCVLMVGSFWTYSDKRWVKLVVIFCSLFCFCCLYVAHFVLFCLHIWAFLSVPGTLRAGGSFE